MACVCLRRERGGGRKEKGSSNFPQLKPRHVVLIRMTFPSPECQSWRTAEWGRRLWNSHGLVLGISDKLPNGQCERQGETLTQKNGLMVL